MDTFNVIAGVASIISLIFSIFATTQVIKIKKQINMDNSNHIGPQIALGKGNKVAGRDIK